MKRLFCVTCLFASTLLFISTQNASAQTSIYGAAALTDFVFFNNGSNAAKSDTGGIIGGVFYNFPIDSRLTAGVDARGSYGIGLRGGETASVALRIGFVPHVVIFRPYFEIGGGIISSTLTSGQITGSIYQGTIMQTTRYTNGGAELTFGLDLRVTSSIDVRAIELGAIAPSSNSNPTKVGSAYLDAGIVYHFKKS